MLHLSGPIPRPPPAPQPASARTPARRSPCRTARCCPPPCARTTASCPRRTRRCTARYGTTSPHRVRQGDRSYGDHAALCCGMVARWADSARREAGDRRGFRALIQTLFPAALRCRPAVLPYRRWRARAAATTCPRSTCAASSRTPTGSSACCHPTPPRTGARARPSPRS